MNDTKLYWKERSSELEVIDSVWTGVASEVTPRTVLADPCSSIILVKGRDNSELILRGPETKPRGDILLPGYVWIGIRLKPGVRLKGFPPQQLTDRYHVLTVDNSGHFEFAGTRLKFPDFEHVEQLITHMYDLGYLSGKALAAPGPPKRGTSAKSHSRYIKHSTGLSPYKLRQLERMAVALRLLRQGMPVAKVASTLGFADQAHLTRAAKQFFGHTPKELLQWPYKP